MRSLQLLWFRKWVESSIGLKFLMAVSGIALVGFLVAHLAGNLLVFGEANAINLYAEKLRDFPAVLWALRIGLIGAVIVHIMSAFKLTQRNRAARPQAYAHRAWQRTSFSSRYMMVSGSLVLVFIVYHLAHLTFRMTHPEFAVLTTFDVRNMLLISFKSPLLTVFYCLCVILLMSHLSHGITSLFQSLGFRHRKYQAVIDGAGPAIAVVLSIGFLSIPLAIFLGAIG